MKRKWKIVILVCLLLVIAGGVLASIKISQRGIVVVQTGKVPYEVIRRAAGSIQAVKGRILGVVMNAVNLKRDGYYYDYYRYYQSYYNETEGSKRR